jgi:hypothetical protein
MANEEQPELNPPSPQRVAERALILAAVICRSGIERDAGNLQAEKFREQVIAWLERLKLSSEAEPQEMGLLKTPLGKLAKKDGVDTSWRTEGLAVLAWALGKYELPNYETQASGPAAAEALGFLKPREETVLHEPRLRSVEEITALSDQIFTLHWRLRQFSLEPAAIDFQEFAKTAWFGPLSLDGLHLSEKDLAIQGLPISRATEQQWRTVMSITQERHQAVNWLEGQEQIYSQVTTDT